jgi:hypothetical protein
VAGRRWRGRSSSTRGLGAMTSSATTVICCIELASSAARSRTVIGAVACARLLQPVSWDTQRAHPWVLALGVLPRDGPWRRLQHSNAAQCYSGYGGERRRVSDQRATTYCDVIRRAVIAAEIDGRCDGRRLTSAYPRSRVAITRRDVARLPEVSERTVTPRDTACEHTGTCSLRVRARHAVEGGRKSAPLKSRHRRFGDGRVRVLDASVRRPGSVVQGKVCWWRNRGTQR